MKLVIAVIAVWAVTGACGPVRTRGESAVPGRAQGSRPSLHRTHDLGTVRVGGERELPSVHVVTREEARDGGSSLWVSADAGTESGELAWLVAHIGESPDRAGSSDSENVRALAAHGATGVRAVVPVFRRADPMRIAFAQRVVERVALRACRLRGGRPAAQGVIHWLETGEAPDVTPTSLETLVWIRRDDTPWPLRAVERLTTWANANTPCREPKSNP